MAKPYFTPIDMGKLEVRNQRVHILASAPGTPVTGQLYYNSTDNTLYWYNGSVWKSADGSVGGIAPSLYDAQSILIAVADNTPVVQTLAASQIVGRKSTGNIGVLSMSELVTELLAADGTGSLLDADLLDGQHLTYVVGRANHTGTQLASTISDFDTQVRTSTLAQMAAPAASVSLNSQKITNLLDPSSAQDAATKAYVDAVAVGIDWKPSVRAASTANVTIASALINASTMDGVTLATGNRVLLKNQTTTAENGIYVVVASGAASRATDADVSAEVTAGLSVFVEEGTVNGDSGWVLTTDGAITLNTTGLTFTQFTGLGQIVDGSGLTKTGNTLNVNVSGAISISSDAVTIAAGAIGDSLLASTFCKKYTATIGDGSTTAIVVTHSLGTRAVTVSVHDATTFDEVIVDVQKTSTTTCTITFAAAPATNSYVVTIIG